MEDIFESFFGAFYITFGFDETLKFLSKLITIDFRYADASPKSSVYQNLEKLGFIPNETFEKSENGEIVCKIILKDDALLYFKSYNLQNPIGTGSGNVKKTAEMKAYQDAHEKFLKRNLTKEFFEKLKHEKELSNTVFDEIRDSFLKKLKSENFVKFEFVSPRSSANRNGSVLQLIGVKQNSNREILASGFFSNQLGNQRHLELINLYLK